MINGNKINEHHPIDNDEHFQHETLPALTSENVETERNCTFLKTPLKRKNNASYDSDDDEDYSSDENSRASFVESKPKSDSEVIVNRRKKGKFSHCEFQLNYDHENNDKHTNSTSATSNHIKSDGTGGKSNTDKVEISRTNSSPCFDRNNNGNDQERSATQNHQSSYRAKGYGLRPRTELRKPSYDFEADEKEITVEVVRRSRTHNRGNLMSKYRRRTANARERHRMCEINTAFSTLRGILPPLNTRKSTQVSMTKIRTLKLAANYIQALSDLLEESDEGIETLRPYSDSVFLQVTTSTTNLATNYHNSNSMKAKRQSKSAMSNSKFETDHFASEKNPNNKYGYANLNFGVEEQNSLSKMEKEFIKKSADISPPKEDEKDLISTFEDESMQSTDMDENLNSWVDYKALEDLYFSLN